ncbi:MAG: phosphonate C-P lyase system protein PhnG, partial [Spirochaetota bacterium]
QPTSSLDRKERFRVLSAGDRELVISLSRQIVDENESISIVTPATHVRLMARMKESVNNSLFNLGDLVATEAEVKIGSARGYMMILGLDKEKALAGAILEAAIAGGHPMTDKLLNALQREKEQMNERADRLWGIVKDSRVNFEGGKIEEYGAADFTKDR